MVLNNSLLHYESVLLSFANEKLSGQDLCKEETGYKNQTKRLGEKVGKSQRVIKKMENKSDIQNSIEIKAKNLKEVHELKEKG